MRPAFFLTKMGGISVSLAAAFGALLSLSAPAIARDDEPDPLILEAEPLVLEASSDWVLDYAEDSCALRRNFGVSGKEVLLELRQYSPFSSLQITVASGDIQMQDQPPQYRFGPDAELRTYNVPASGAYGEDRQGVVFFGRILHSLVFEPGEQLSTSQLAERIAKASGEISEFYLEGPFEQNILLKTGPLGAPVGALNNCIRDLVGSWGALQFLDEFGTKQPVPLRQRNWGAHISRSFPRELRGERENTLFIIRLLLDETGKTTACRVQQPLVGSIYQDFACGPILKKAKHKPAESEAGDAIPSFRLLRVVYGASR